MELSKIDPWRLLLLLELLALLPVFTFCANRRLGSASSLMYANS
jgi:hypothetical protein